MSSFATIWIWIKDWFEDRSERTILIRSFNEAAREAFVIVIAPVLLQATISKGYRPYRHQFSSLLGGSGFRIKAMSGRQLTKDDIASIGAVVLADNILVRRLVVLGFDTFEVHCDVGTYGCRWQLYDFILIGSNS